MPFSPQTPFTSLPEILNKPIGSVSIPIDKPTVQEALIDAMGQHMVDFREANNPQWIKLLGPSRPEPEPTLNELSNEIKELRKEVEHLKTKANSRIKIYQMEDIKKYE